MVFSGSHEGVMSVFPARKDKDHGYTLLEVLAVVVILVILASIAMPNLLASARSARENADIATGHQIKTALDRYFIEHGVYPTFSEMTSDDGKIIAKGFIPEYISPLTPAVTQQQATDDVKGFGVAKINPDGSLPESGQMRLVMIYLDDFGTRAEVRVYNSDLSTVLWSSAD